MRDPYPLFAEEGEGWWWKGVGGWVRRVGWGVGRIGRRGKGKERRDSVVAGVCGEGVHECGVYAVGE